MKMILKVELMTKMMTFDKTNNRSKKIFEME